MVFILGAMNYKVIFILCTTKYNAIASKSSSHVKENYCHKCLI